MDRNEAYYAELARVLTASLRVSSSVFGFHGLAERASSPLSRTIYEAQAYAAGLELAVCVAQLNALLDPPD